MRHSDRPDIDRCPGCGSGWLKRRKNAELIQCLTCEHAFPASQVIKRATRERTDSGSGQFAGRIVVPQYKWSGVRTGRRAE